MPAEDNHASGAGIGATDPSDRFGRLFHLIGDAVVEIELVDRHPIVRSVNPAFEEVFGYEADRVRGRSLNEFIIPEHFDEEAATFDERTARGVENHALVRRQTATGVRDFLYRGVPYTREDGRQFGFAIYSDVTDQQTHERHMKVLHRILRHNLRNDLTVIRGTASHLATVADRPELVTGAERIVRRTRQLASVGEELRTLERILAGEHASLSLDLGRVCADVVAALAEEYPDASLRLAVPTGLTARAIPELEPAIRGLVENGIVHNEGEATVRLVATRQRGRLFLDVLDDGPGIPETEREAVFGDSQLTQLHHGSGLGLWLARCAVEASDGRLTYRRLDGWTLVRLVLRDVPEE